MMKLSSKTLLVHALFVIMLTVISYAFAYFFYPRLSLNDILLPSLVFAFISIIVLVVFETGQSKEKDSRSLFTMAAMGLKFFLSMVFALVYFAVLKKTSTEYIILFFLLYLAFTIYLIVIIIKVLKIKSLKQG